jgi:hypothetical protein
VTVGGTSRFGGGLGSLGSSFNRDIILEVFRAVSCCRTGVTAGACGREGPGNSWGIGGPLIELRETCWRLGSEVGLLLVVSLPVFLIAGTPLGPYC